MAQYVKVCSVPCKFTWDDLQALCRRKKLVCEQLAVTRNNLNDYEVEYLCNYRRIKVRGNKTGHEFFLVKWKDMRSLLQHAVKPLDSLSLDGSAVPFLFQQAKQCMKLVLWEEQLNHTCRHKGRIFVLNEVDLDEDVRLGQALAGGCECFDCIREPVRGSCAGASQHRATYNGSGQVKIRPGFPIYECNSVCRCGNRVAQRGIQYDLCIFKTKIHRNAFVMEYLGEIITSEKAEKRGETYDKQGATYLFDLDYLDDVYTVDAAHYGNISHFVNHSCDPNLQVYNVFIDNLDERLPRIAFFATQLIKAGEELTFDYKMTTDTLDAESIKMYANFSLAGAQSTAIKRIRIECKCRAEKCQKYLLF
uniref:Histone-lysine N-methyltransferase n=1 Tax=Electrophorus electricus TaxID=8005 RepID=A0A4W4GD36_ELEEL